MKVHSYEKGFLWAGALMLVGFMLALAYASTAMGIRLPGRAGTVDPQQVRVTPPFDDPGVRQVGPDEYEVVVIGQVWSFVPAEIRVPAGAHVTFIATSPDVLHGFHIEGTRLNMMLVPGQISRNSYTFAEPGEYLIICHEYCGIAHHTMYGKVIVE
jgi:cytochrome c oxidase subunit II